MVHVVHMHMHMHMVHIHMHMRMHMHMPHAHACTCNMPMACTLDLQYVYRAGSQSRDHILSDLRAEIISYQISEPRARHHRSLEPRTSKPQGPRLAGRAPGTRP